MSEALALTVLLWLVMCLWAVTLCRATAKETPTPETAERDMPATGSSSELGHLEKEERGRMQETS